MESIHRLVENRKLVPVSDSGVIKFRLRKPIDKFESRQRKLQEAFFTDRVNDIWHKILKEQEKEMRTAEKQQKEVKV